MKTVAVAVIVLVAAALVQAETTETFRSKVRPVAEACRSEEKATADDVDSLLHLRTRFSEEGKCMLACVMGRMELLKDGHLVSHEAHVKIHKALFADDKDKLDRAEQITEKCRPRAEAKSSNVCQMAHEILTCLLEK